MRVCLIYDCLYPWTVGGAERWYRALAERLAAEGHAVTYLTLRQWDAETPPAIPGVEVVAVGPRLALYAGGRRRIWPTLRFGAGVVRALAAQGRRYDVVHCAGFPYFSTLAAGALRRRGGYRLVIDWWEVWSRDYWRAYLGPIRGRIGHAVQRRCVRLRHVALYYSELHGRRLLAEGYRGEPICASGIYAGPTAPPDPEPPDPYVLYVGRHIPEKRVPALVDALAVARRSMPDLRAVIVGDGPDRQRVAAAVARHGLQDAVSLPGFVSEAELDGLLRRAACLALPSEREGFGLALLDAIARGTPVVTACAPDNAAAELVAPGVNGAVAASASAENLASAILSVTTAGMPLRVSTARWWTEHAARLSAEAGFVVVLAAYAGVEARVER